MIEYNNGSITVTATVKKIFPIEEKSWWFQIRKVWIEFDSKNPELPF